VDQAARHDDTAKMNRGIVNQGIINL
jgi:hypothetical protein